MCPQLVAKTKYIDTLIKLLLTYLLTSSARSLDVGSSLHPTVKIKMAVLVEGLFLKFNTEILFVNTRNC